MSITSFLPDDLYLYRQEEPDVGGDRPISQGDVFVDIPLVRAANKKEGNPNQWVAPIKMGPNSMGMLVSHPCSSRSRTSHELKESLSIAPVVRCPHGFEAPWAGYYEYFPLPGLKDGNAYVADLSSICPVRSEFLPGKRVACLTADGLAALFHRLAVNFARLDRIPDHFAAEAQRLFFEVSLWQRWMEAQKTEDGFQAWLDEEFVAPPLEDQNGDPIPGSERPSGGPRRAALRWNYEHIERQLDQHIAEN